MKQETGETRDAIIEEDNKIIAEIISKNKDRKEPYWIMIFAKPSKVCVDGMPTLHKYINPFAVKPLPQVGAVIGEVDNKKGTIEWQVNMPQRPFDFDGLKAFGAEDANDVVVETISIPNAYITQ